MRLILEEKVGEYMKTIKIKYNKKKDQESTINIDKGKVWKWFLFVQNMPGCCIHLKVNRCGGKI